MSVVLTEMTLRPGQEPVGNSPFDVDLELFFDATQDTDRAGTVVFWCNGAFSVVPHKVAVEVKKGTTATVTCTLKLDGALPTSPTIARVYAECDERHSIYVRIV